MSLAVRPLTAGDRAWVAARTVELFGGENVLSRGRTHVPAELDGFAALLGEERVGLVTWRLDGEEAEIVTLDASPRLAGTGTALLAAVEEAARSAGARRLVLVTTNDNLDAIRFYQRRGFRLTALRPGAMEEVRRAKPAVPETGQYGIPLRDEVELGKELS